MTSFARFMFSSLNSKGICVKASRERKVLPALTYLEVIVWGITMLPENEYLMLPDLRADRPRREHLSCEGERWITVSATKSERESVLRGLPTFANERRNRGTVDGSFQIQSPSSDWHSTYTGSSNHVHDITGITNDSSSALYSCRPWISGKRRLSFFRKAYPVLWKPPFTSSSRYVPSASLSFDPIYATMLESSPITLIQVPWNFSFYPASKE